jgi:hypothetical protein
VRVRGDELGAPVWRGEPGRTEVWYATFTDRATGLGGWVHAETVAPTDGAAPYAHGWVALFPAAGPAVVERFGPGPVEPPEDDAGTWFRLGDVVVGPGVLRGTTATGEWDLTLEHDGPPLFTFPRVVWERHLLPGAQIVPHPTARVRGRVRVGEARADVDGHGALARIFGHGSAQQWGWLHAPLDEGGLLEIVTATARRPGLRRIPPLAMVQLRLPGEPDWPRNPALAAVRFRTHLRDDGFTVTGRHRGRRLEVDVSLPAERRVALGYVDPDGSTATCTNSERASATVRLDDRTWRLDGTAHAEVGARP